MPVKQLALVTMLLVSCSKKHEATDDAWVKQKQLTTCSDRGGGSKMLSWKNCSDGVERIIECDDKNKKVSCVCKENGVVKKTFDATALYAKDPTPLLASHSGHAVAHDQCGWSEIETP
jgi:hypothetical protein